MPHVFKGIGFSSIARFQGLCLEEASCGEASLAPNGRTCRDIMVRNGTAEYEANAAENTLVAAKVATFPVKATD